MSNKVKSDYLDFYKQDFIKDLTVPQIHKLFCEKFRKNITIHAVYGYLKYHKILYKADIVGRRKGSGGHKKRTHTIELSEAEKEILPYLNLSNKQIAKKLWKSKTTISTQLTSIFDKLGTRSKINTVIKSIKTGLINIEEIKVNAETNNYKRR